MIGKTTEEIISKIINAIGQRIPGYSSNPADAFAGGNVAVCIIDQEGNIHGKIWGSNKVRGREFFRLAWTKASQVWITGMKTGEYEKKLFNGEFDESTYGIVEARSHRMGGRSARDPRGTDTVLSVGFSGFRGINDLDIVVKAVADVAGDPK